MLKAASSRYYDTELFIVSKICSFGFYKRKTVIECMVDVPHSSI